MPDDSNNHGQQSKGLVILIDEEKIPMETYVKALELAEFEVRQYFDPDPFFTFLDEEEPDIAAIVLDIMMPVKEKGRYAKEETDEGLKTGYYVYRDLRAIERYSTVPIVVLTNIAYQKSLNIFPDEPHLEKWKKLDCPPTKLAERVVKMIQP